MRGRQIINVYTSDKVLEFNDYLQINQGEKDNEQFFNTKAKIEAVMVDFANKEQTITAKYNFDPDNLQTICYLIMQGNTSVFEQGYAETKTNIYKKDDKGIAPVSKFAIKYNPQMKRKWQISIENGKGEVVEKENGTINFKNYQKESSITMYLSDFEILKLAINLYNYINNFQVVFLREFLKNRQEKNKKVVQLNPRNNTQSTQKKTATTK